MKERREARQFEPPPWEAEQFGDRGPSTQGDDGALAAEAEAPPTMGEAAAAVIVQHSKTAEDGGEKSEADGSDDAAVEAMLAQLAAEEPRTDEGLVRAGTVAAVAFALIGAVISVWGITAIATASKGGRVAIAGGAGMIALGGLFFVVGAWVVLNNLRKRGFI